jgi:hypothetical protein
MSTSTTRPAFLIALEQLEKTKPSDIVERLYAVFSSIAHMDADEVIAAYQTIKLAAMRTGTALIEIAPLLDACEAQMRGSWDHACETKIAAEGVSFRRFSAVIGFPLSWVGESQYRDELKKVRQQRLV